MLYDGDDLIRDDPNGRYVHGDGVDEPLVWYDANGARHFLHADERGSIIAVTDSAGGLTGINRYDDYGNVQGAQTGRFGYTGQFTLPGGIVHYKARAYEPGLGRFLQTDPVGYDAGANLYAYVGNDPANLVDPLGLNIEVIGKRLREQNITTSPGFNTGPGGGGGGGSMGPGGGGGATCLGGCVPIDVVAKQLPPRPSEENRDGHDTEIVIQPAVPSTPRVFAAGVSKRKRQDFCGSRGSEWVPEGNWQQACRIHDECYGTAGANKFVCDAELGIDVTANCIEDIWLPPICAVPGVIFWGGVSLGGWGPYLRSQRRTQRQGGW